MKKRHWEHRDMKRYRERLYMKIVGKRGYEKVPGTPGYENYQEHQDMKMYRVTGIGKSGYEESTEDTGLIGGTKYRTYNLGEL